MRIFKWIFQKNIYKVKFIDICQDNKLEPPNQTILKTNLKYILIMHEKEVKQLLDMLIKERVRTPRKLAIKLQLTATLSYIMHYHLT